MMGGWDERLINRKDQKGGAGKKGCPVGASHHGMPLGLSLANQPVL